MFGNKSKVKSHISQRSKKKQGKNKVHKLIIEETKNELTLSNILEGVMDTFNHMLRANVYEQGFNQKEIELRLERKKELRWALRNCIHGDLSAKIYVKDHIKDILLQKYKLNGETINQVIAFDKLEQLSPIDQFDILIYLYKKDYQYQALDKMLTELKLVKEKYNEEAYLYYEISKEDIEEAFLQENRIYLSFHDKLNILTQRIFQLYKGNGVIDEIRDMKIDGVSAGVSGIPESFEIDEVLKQKRMPASYDSIWIFYKGKSIHLSFLSFGNYKELIRVCKNIYRYQNPGQLSEVRGYIVNEMKDGSRVAVARPPFCETWVLFVRKFDSVLQEDISHLITDNNNQLAIKIMKWLIKGCQITAVTGEQGSGKTTLLISLISFIHPTYNLRIQELSFELHLRKIYPKRNIVTFRETNCITGQEGLDFQKKTDGSVNILGEVATAGVSVWLVQMSQVASLFTLFTHHAKTTNDLITSMRNSLLLEGGFQNERAATEQVVDAIRFDIHMKKSVEGHRYIERITEVISKKKTVFQKVYESEKNELTTAMFETRNLIEYHDGSYFFCNNFSKQSLLEINNHLNSKEKEEFLEDQKKWEEMKYGINI